MEKLIYDTGKVPLVIRIIAMPFAFGALYLAGNVAYGSICNSSAELKIWTTLLQFGLSLWLAGFLFSTWLLQNRIFYSASANEIIVQHRGLFGTSVRRISFIC